MRLLCWNPPWNMCHGIVDQLLGGSYYLMLIACFVILKHIPSRMLVLMPLSAMTLAAVAAAHVTIMIDVICRMHPEIDGAYNAIIPMKLLTIPLIT